MNRRYKIVKLNSYEYGIWDSQDGRFLTAENGRSTWSARRRKIAKLNLKHRIRTDQQKSEGGLS